MPFNSYNYNGIKVEISNLRNSRKYAALWGLNNNAPEWIEGHRRNPMRNKTKFLETNEDDSTIT